MNYHHVALTTTECKILREAVRDYRTFLVSSIAREKSPKQRAEDGRTVDLVDDLVSKIETLLIGEH